MQLSGITDIEELAMTYPQELAAIKGISFQRAEKWIDEACNKAKTHSAYFFKESGPLMDVRTIDWPDRIDPYRLRRSLQLTVKIMNNSLYWVTGGLDPHQVKATNSALHCDCMPPIHGRAQDF